MRFGNMGNTKVKSKKRQVIEISITAVILAGLCIAMVLIFPAKPPTAPAAASLQPAAAKPSDSKELADLKRRVAPGYSEAELTDFLKMQEQIQPFIAKYAAEKRQSPKGAEALSALPKAVLLTQDVKASDWKAQKDKPPVYTYNDDNLAIPAAVRARSVSDANAVFLVKYSAELKGTYIGDESSGYSWVAGVSVLDPAEGFLSPLSKEFTGGDPPKEKSGGGDRYGTFPTDQIIKYIRYLYNVPPGEGDSEKPAGAASAAPVDPGALHPGYIDAGGTFTVGVKRDGVPAIAGQYNTRTIDVGSWKDIVAVAAGNEHIAGLRADGTVAATGDKSAGQCGVSGWSGIVAIDAGKEHTVGLKADGTVIAAGDNTYGQCGVQDWKDVTAVSAGGNNTVGVKKDGGYYTAGYGSIWNKPFGNTAALNNGAAVAASVGEDCVAFLLKDGTVAGWAFESLDVSGFKDITAVSAGKAVVAGLKADGTAVASNKNGGFDLSGWKNIIAVAAGADYAVGLDQDGTVWMTGPNANMNKIPGMEGIGPRK
jgi:hypothetical protein